jgi:hypothetical protein
MQGPRSGYRDEACFVYQEEQTRFGEDQNQA